MESFLLALGSLVILVPLLYFLPLGLSLRGKFIVIVLAFLLATTGLVISLTYPLWLTGLVLLFLVLLFTVFLNAKLKKHLYSEVSASEDESNEELNHESDEDNGDLDIVTAEETANPDTLMSDSEEENSSEVTMMEEEADAVENSDSKAESEDDDHSLSAEEVELAQESDHINPIELALNEIAVSESSTEASSDEERVDSEEDPSIEEQQLLENKKVEEDTQEYESFQDVGINDEERLEESITNAKDDFIEAEAFNEEPVGDLKAEKDVEVSKAEEDSPAVHNDEHVEKSNREVQRTVLQQQLFHTMVSQLHLARKRMKRDEYEILIKEHLHPNLPALDYYTFSSLLIEHYIRNKELVKLNYLLLDLTERMKEYPILVMEIQYLYEQYCENIL